MGSRSLRLTTLLVLALCVGRSWVTASLTLWSLERQAAIPALRASRTTASRVWRSLDGHVLDGGHRLHEKLPLWRFPGFLSRPDAMELMELGEYEHQTPFRRRSRGDVPHGKIEQQLRARVASLLGLDEALFEPFRLVEYSRVGDTFEQHVDWIADETDPQLQLLGQRVATGLLYLTDVPSSAGGGTAFDRLGVEVQPQAGDLLVWPNVDAKGRPLVATEHEARPLAKEGVRKVAVNIWARDRHIPTDPEVLTTLLLS